MRQILTKIINLFGGPGCGKSTTAAEIFVSLKKRNMSVELVTEFAKDLVWAKRDRCLSVQPYVFGKQLYRIERLVGQVDFIVTDSPVLLSALYVQHNTKLFIPFVVAEFNRFENWNYLIHRTKPYVESGRNQIETEAKYLDKLTKDLLDAYDIEYQELSTFHIIEHLSELPFITL